MNLKLNLKVKIFFLLTLNILIWTHCTTTSSTWESKNNSLIEQYGLQERKLDNNPDSNISSNLEAGKVNNLDNLESYELHPGVQAKIFWGSGVLVSILEIDPGAEIPEEEVSTEKFLFLLEGDIELSTNQQQIAMQALEREAPDGIHGGTPKVDFIYLKKGSNQRIVSGKSGAKIIEVYSPQRIDYMELAGNENHADTPMDFESNNSTNVSPNQVYNLYDIQLTKLASGAYSRLISGSHMTLSFIYLDPETNFENHIHPEEQILLTLRGSTEQILLDEKHLMETNDLVRIPGNYVHATEVGERGFDGLDIFWPSRSDYMDKEKKSKAAFEAIIPKDAKVEQVIDGKKTKPELFFTEGPKWMNGKLYFSNMYFDQDFNADPSKSSIVEMTSDGNYKNITEGKMQANGLYPYKNGNLIVCDMMGHRIVEMTTQGQVVRVLADKYDGKPIDGPNDIVTDSKGGFYFTDPQFTMEEEKFQPGRAVYYVSPSGEISRITEPNEFAMPNGILLSPDGKTLYINNTYDKESWYPVQSEKDNYIWAYDVSDDGSISNGREFAKALLVGDVLEREGRSSGADGMAIDEEGNIYVATYYGVQIFDKEGEYVGMINLPTFPISLTFGDEDMKTLYIVSFSNVYKIRTNKEGYINYLD